MGGYYRPLFGKMSPDHTQLAQKAVAVALTGSSRSQNLLYTAGTIGTAPNVPYANIHLIGKRKYATNDNDKTTGFAFNGGLRFVKLSGSINYSFWQSENVGEGTQTQMQSLDGGLKFGRATVNSEFLYLTRDEPAVYKEGNIFTLESHIRLFRENYLTLYTAEANTTPNLTPGKTNETRFGFRSFLFPGMDLSFYWGSEAVVTDSEARDSQYVIQLHSFF